MSKPLIRAIPTEYRGIIFRSKLEAKWAAMFDQLEWHWEYEPSQDLNGYLPDFVLQFYEPVLAEIKPANTIDEIRTYTPKLAASGWRGPALLFGAMLDLSPYSSRRGPTCCLYGQPIAEDCWDWQPGEMFKCGICGAYSIVHDCGSYRSLSCGHQDGQRYLQPLNKNRVLSYWARATNLVRFNPEGIFV